MAESLAEIEARHKAELKTAKLEDALVQAKGEPETCDACGRPLPKPVDAKLRKIKDELRAHRAEQRAAEGRE